MPFFLLTRDEDGQLRLLTSTAAATRQDALAELSRITAESAFDQWESDVLLLDLDAALPVLLVRPTPAAAATELEFARAEEPVVAVVEEPEAESWPLAEPDTDTEPALAPEPDADTESAPAAEPDAETEFPPAVEPSAEFMFVAPSSDQSEWRAIGAPLPVPKPEVEIPAEEADAFAAYVAPSTDGEPDVEVVVPPEVEAEIAAKDEVPATRYPVPEMATELLEEPVEPEREIETISIPVDEIIAEPSISTNEYIAAADEEIEFRSPGESRIESEPMPDGPTEPDEADELRDALARTTVVMAAEAASVPPDEVTGDFDQPSATAEPALETWPWDTKPAHPEPDSANSMPYPDDELQAPTEAAEQPSAVSDFLMDLEPIPSAGVNASAVEAEDATPAEPTVVTPEYIPEPASEFMQDEPGVEETAGAAFETPAEPASVGMQTAPAIEDADSEPAVREPSALDGYVCTDCVYVATCPNKDQRLPRDCVSFQWK